MEEQKKEIAVPPALKPIVPERNLITRRALMPVTVEDTFRLAEILAKSNLVPAPYQNNPANCFLAIELGRELGIGWASAIQNSYIVDSRPRLYGNIILGICRSCPAFEYIKEEYDPKTKTATCTVKRKDDPFPVIRNYSFEMAKIAGLTGKNNWQKNEIRMTQLRARNWALGDCFADWLNGMEVAEDEVTIVESLPGGTMDIPQTKNLMPSSTEDMPANTNNEKPVPGTNIFLIDEKQRQELFKHLVKYKVTKEAWMRYLKVIGIEMTQDLPATLFEDAKKWIEKFELVKK